MEATGEEELSILSKIRPPRLEDAGVEDCALPPDSIHKAFLKAASILAGDTHHGGCVTDTSPEKSPPSDVLIGISPEGSPPGPCANGKGGALIGDDDSARDVVGQRNEGDIKGSDEVVVIGEGEGEGEGEGVGECGGDCVDGLSGLDIKEREHQDQDEDEDKNEKPTLVEGYLLNP